MRRAKNVQKVIDSQKRTIDPAYDIEPEEIRQIADIMEKKGGSLNFVIVNAFIYGYNMGRKAEKAASIKSEC